MKDKLNDPRQRKTFQGINYQELLYADDTLTIAQSSRTANDYLHVVEEESEYLHLKLNQAKCCYIAYNCRGTIRLENGENMESTEEATERAEPRHEIQKRISATIALLQKLDVFWPKTNCTKRWKLLVFNAVVTSKVLYGLETLEPTCSAGNLLDTFQLKGLRKILRLHTTFVQRNNTNEYVYKRASSEVLGAPNRRCREKDEAHNRSSCAEALETIGTCFTKRTAASAASVGLSNTIRGAKRNRA